MLCHEGSSPPQSKPAQPRPLDSSLVLDIAGLAAVSDNRFVCDYVQLPYQFQFNMSAFINTRGFEETECKSCLFNLLTIAALSH